MERLIPSASNVNQMKKRDAYDKVLNFIDSDRCYDGKVGIIYGLRRTGKTTIMQQIIAENADRLSFEFWEATSDDTMDDVYACLKSALKNNVDCVFIDEITNVSDFIDESACLADIYAKEGLRIVLAGTDSLSFVFAEDHSLYDRTEHISTTYIPFEEHCRVLGTKDMDDYISYGGLMKKGLTDKDRIVHDYLSTCKYLDDAVAGNISRSMHYAAQYTNDIELYNVPPREMTAVIEKMVEKYSGVLNTKLANNALNKIVLLFPTYKDEFIELEGIEVFETLDANKPYIINEFVKAISADAQITYKWDANMILRLENELKNLKFISAIDVQKFTYDDNFGWGNAPSLDKEYYLIQPAIKYYHLKKALEFVESNEHYNSLSEEGKKFVMDKLDSKIRGDMTEQIVVFETSEALPREDFIVRKIKFSNTDPNKGKGEYDMLIYDIKAKSYFAFEIKHTTNPYSGQYCHLMNEKFKEVIDSKYGDKENVAVLYNGTPFETPSGVLYLNISDFLKEITHTKDAKTALQNLSQNLPIRDLESEEKDDVCSSPNNSLKDSIKATKTSKFDKTDD